MALLHNATLTPTKRELLDGWLPGRSWFDGTLERDPVGSFRLDDPDGEVGMEGFLLGSADSTLFVPLTYRAAPLDGAEDHLIGTTEHSVLGTRWVYDGCGDPVFVRTLAATILTGGVGAEEFFESDGERRTREPSASVRGSGSSDTEAPELTGAAPYDEGPLTIVDAGPLDLVVARVVGSELTAAQTLAVTWKGGAGVVVAGVRPA